MKHKKGTQGNKNTFAINIPTARKQMAINNASK